MITLELARALADAGVLWEPAPGDRFAIDTPNLVGEVFWISELTIELHHYRGQPQLGFNGTTEWALDSVDLDEALWLPREDQLRALVGDRFVSLAATEDGWVVTHRGSAGVAVQSHDQDVECAYARALLTLA